MDKTASDWIKEAKQYHDTAHIPENFQKMQECYEAALRLEPDNWEALYWMGRCLCGSPTGEGLPYFNKASALNPGNSEIWTWLSVALMNCGRTQEAKKALARALELDPGNAEAHFQKSLELGSEGAPNEQRFKEILLCLRYDPSHPLAGMLYRAATGQDYKPEGRKKGQAVKPAQKAVRPAGVQSIWRKIQGIFRSKH
jgi:tetratricopeptide (TPR) repeat protein